MPFRPQHSLLRVEVPALQSIDTNSVEDLFAMWSLFSKTSHAMEHGKRLENLSWRLWNRETFCCAPESPAPSALPRPCSFAAQPKAAANDIPVPALSSSLDSASSDEIDDDEPTAPSAVATAIPNSRPEIRRSDSMDSRRRGHEKHITPIDLEKIVISIKETQPLEPIDLPMHTPSAPGELHRTSTTSQQAASSSPRQTSHQPQHHTSTSLTPSHTTPLESSASTVDTNDEKTSQAGSDASTNTEMSTHSVVRGFVPGGAPSSYRSQTHLAPSAQPTPITKSTSPRYQHAQSKTKPAKFTIGTSSGEDESSLDSHMYKSSLATSLRGPGSNVSSGSSTKKQATFKDEIAVARAAEHSPVFESDDEDEDVSESAIEDADDSSDWEDSDEQQSGPSSVNDGNLFKRVDSRPNLTSRRSLLTTMMHEPDRAKALANAASRSSPAIRRSRNSTPNGPSAPSSPDHRPSPQLQPQRTHLEPPAEHPRAKPIIMTTSNTHEQPASSPRTTRRNMLSTELTESLRKNLLWERQHKSTGNLNAMKRRHTSNDVKNLKQHPEPKPTFSPQGARSFTNDFFDHGLQEYHAKGW